MDEVDHIELANQKSLEDFEKEYMPGNDWKLFRHPTTAAIYTLALHTSSSLSEADLTACFALIELTSSKDYGKSKGGWKPRAKKEEMKLLDLKYLLVKKAEDGSVQGFMSLMPTYEDGFPVVYCYEIHLSAELRGTGLGRMMMGYLEDVARRLPETEKVMLTVFTRNKRAVEFYGKLGYSTDMYSPEPRVLRNGTVVKNGAWILEGIDFAVGQQELNVSLAKNLAEGTSAGTIHVKLSSRGWE
ncbi:hypothetical protein LZ554_004264 [Drepanopeziza brunnea f. sp. 'monogermtubi']|nr:hypothetical protein LZ554_004264 [Drepanopeziza brunnea f. sp. 'monogermtubi']